MDKHTTWVTFTVTEDGYQARPICNAPGIPTGCCALVNGKCADAPVPR